MRSSSNIVHRVIRHPDVALASVRYHSNRVVTRPIRTIGAVVITYAMVVLLVAFTRDPEAMRAFLQADPSLSGLVPLLPPPLFLLVLAGAAIVGVPIGMVTTGVRRDLSSSRRRRQRRNG